MKKLFLIFPILLLAWHCPAPIPYIVTLSGVGTNVTMNSPFVTTSNNIIFLGSISNAANSVSYVYQGTTLPAAIISAYGLTGNGNWPYWSNVNSTAGWLIISNYQGQLNPYITPPGQYIIDYYADWITANVGPAAFANAGIAAPDWIANAIVNFQPTFCAFGQNTNAALVINGSGLAQADLQVNGNLYAQTGAVSSLTATQIYGAQSYMTGAISQFPVPIASIFGSGTNYTKSIGLSYTHMLPEITGGGEAIYNTSPYGSDVWQRQPGPWVFVSDFRKPTGMTVTQWATNIVTAFAAWGLSSAFTNAGIDMYMEWDAGWASNSRTAGNMLQESNSVVPGTFTNLNAYVHSQNFKSMVHLGYTPHDFGYNTFDNTDQITPTTQMTADWDCWWLWNRGFDSVIVSDGENSQNDGNINTLPYFFRGMGRVFSERTQYPAGILPWIGWGNTNNSGRNALTLVLFATGIQGASRNLVPNGLPQELGYFCNAINSDQAGATPPGTQTNGGAYMFQARISYTNGLMCGKGHWISSMYVGEWAGPTYLNTNDLQWGLSLLTCFPNQLFMNTNASGASTNWCYTNSYFLSDWADSLGNPGFFFIDTGASNFSAVCKPLTGGNIELVLNNEYSANTNWTISFSQLKSPAWFQPIGTVTYPWSAPTNHTFVGVDCWQNTNFIVGGSGSFTITVPSHCQKMINLYDQGIPARTFYTTNFTINYPVTNNTPFNMDLAVCPVFTLAEVNGYASLNGVVWNQTGSGIYTNVAEQWASNNFVTQAITNTAMIITVPPGDYGFFTNVSSGAGNSAGLMPGGWIKLY